MRDTLSSRASLRPTRRMVAGGFGAGTLGGLQAEPVRQDGRCHAHHAVDPTIRPALARMSAGALTEGEARAIAALLPESAFPRGKRPRNVRLQKN